MVSRVIERREQLLVGMKVMVFIRFTEIDVKTILKRAIHISTKLQIPLLKIVITLRIESKIKQIGVPTEKIWRENSGAREPGVGVVILLGHRRIDEGGGGSDDGVGEGFDERNNREAVVAVGEAVGRVDISVAGSAESGGVGLAGYNRRGLLADIAHPDPLMEVSGDGAVTSATEEGGMSSAVKKRRRSTASIARSR